MERKERERVTERNTTLFHLRKCVSISTIRQWTTALFRLGGQSIYAMCDGTKLILSRQRENIQMKIEDRGTKKLFARRIRNEKKNKKKLKLKFFFYWETPPLLPKPGKNEREREYNCYNFGMS